MQTKTAPVNSVVHLLQTLVRTPSVHPEGNPGTEHTGELACAEVVAEFLRAAGADVTFEDVLPGRPNVVGRWAPARPGKPFLIFAPHTDTVSVAGMTIDPFSGELRDGRVWGRGASDTKGSIAAMLWAIHRSQHLLSRLSYEVIFAGLCSEEAGQNGAKQFVSQYEAQMRERGAFVIAGEPTGLNAVTAHKGALWLTVEAAGKAVHAAEPERGDNAIYKMMDVLQGVSDIVTPRERMTVHPLLGPTTVSTGRIEGGSKINIVPDACRAEIDIRFLPGDDRILERISADLRRRHEDVRISHILSRPMETNADHPAIKVLQGLGSRTIGAPWFSDAAIFAHAGVPAIACGPGSIAQAHTKDEFISIEDLEQGAGFFQRFLEQLVEF